MFDTATLTISGNVVADPKIAGNPLSPDRATFRVVSNRRRRDVQTGEWVSAGEYGINVVCWRKLARGVAQSLHRGDPVLVVGRVSSHDYVDSDGNRRWMTELTADFVGHDLSQGTSGNFIRFNRIDQAGAGDGNGAPDGDGGNGDPLGRQADDEFAAAVEDVFGSDVDSAATLV